MRISDWSSDVCSSDLAATSAASANPPEARFTSRLVGVGKFPVRVVALVRAREGPDVVRFDGIGQRAGDHIAVRIARDGGDIGVERSDEHTSELQSLMRTSYAVLCLQKKITKTTYSSPYTNPTSTPYILNSPKHN